MKVSIIGTTGYGGAELIRILHSHPSFTIKSVHTTRDEVPVWNEYPHLFNIMENKLEPINPEKIAKECDIVFLLLLQVYLESWFKNSQIKRFKWLIYLEIFA